MIDKHAAAEAIRVLAVRYESMVAAADLLDGIASQENAAAAAVKAKDAAYLERDEALKALAEANQAVADAQALAAETAKQAIFDAEIVVSQAKLDGEKLVSDAKIAAEHTAKAVEMSAKKALEALSSRIEAAGLKLDGLNAAIKDAQERSDAAIAGAEIAESRLAKVKSQIAELAGV